MKKLSVRVVVFLVIFIYVISRHFLNMAKEGGKTVSLVDKEVIVLNSTKLDKKNNGKLVLVSGSVTTSNKAMDSEFLVDVDSPILEREVWMYKKFENISEEVEVDWQKTYDSDTLINKNTNNEFNNPVRAIDNELFYGKVMLGDFEIDFSKKKIQNKKTYYSTNSSYEVLSSDNLSNTDGYQYLYRCGNKYSKTFDNESCTKEIIKNNNREYFTKDSNSSIDELNKVNFKLIDGVISTEEDLVHIGDERVKYKYLDLEKLGKITVLGKQENGKITPYKLSNGNSVFHIYEGKISKATALKYLSKYQKNSNARKLVFGLLLILIFVALFKDYIKDFFNKK